MATKKFTFSGVLWTDRVKFYPEPQQLAELYPSVTPFLTAAMARYNPNSMQLDSPDYKFFEYRAGWRNQKFVVDGSPSAWSDPGAGAGTPGGTVSIDIDGIVGMPSSADASWLNHVVEIWNTDEDTYKGVALITTVTDSDTVVLTAISNPTSSSEAVAALADNDVCYVIGTAFGEETEAPEANSDELEVVWNSCHLERTTIEIGQTLQRAALRGESDELARLRDEKGKEHKIKMARAFYFGARPGGIGGTAHGAGGGTDSTFVNHISDANSNKVRTTMGLFPALRRYGRSDSTNDQQNVFSFTKATMSFNDFVEMAEKDFQYSPSGGVKELYCGPGAVTFFNKIGEEGLLTKGGAEGPSRVQFNLSNATLTSSGIRIQMLETPHGVYRVIKDPLLRSTPYASHCLSIDPDNVALVRYEPDEYLSNIKTDNNPRVIKDEIKSFPGIKLGLVERHSWVSLT